MIVALSLLAVQGAIGAFDTLYYHEWKARLPARGRRAAPELALHAARDFLYGVLFATLPWFAWTGAWARVLVAVIVAEIVLTLWDFVVEIAGLATIHMDACARTSALQAKYRCHALRYGVPESAT